MKKVLIGLVVIVLIVAGWYLITKNREVQNPPTETPVVTPTSTVPVVENKPEESIGRSVENRDIMAYHFGDGEEEILFVGGIHGGYEWNTALVAYEAIDYFRANPNAIPDNVKVTVVPVLNPDGLAKVTSVTGKFAPSDINSSKDVQVSGRFNANKVDLNRNFDCDWKSEGKWQTTTVSGGTAAFSEPESIAIKNYIEANDPVAVVVYYSAAGGVFASNCHNDAVLADTTALTNAYAKASGYPAYNSFNFYEITGDMVNWLAKSKIPAISVLLTNHTDTEWTKNQKGIEAVLAYYAEAEATTTTPTTTTE
jgi:hypothetical protein